MHIQLFSYIKNTKQEYKFCSITTIQPKSQFFVKTDSESYMYSRIRKKTNLLSKISLATTADLSKPTHNSNYNAQINIQ